MQAPAPAPVTAPVPAAPPAPVETPAPQRLRDVVQGRERTHKTRKTHETHKTRTTRTTRKTSPQVRPAHRVVAARTVALRTAPRGGVQAGAGGSAAGLPLSIPAAGLTL